jgi:hypothetical protein
MPRKDGIHTLEDLRARCYVDEDTGCWHWRGGTSRKSDGHKVPACWFDGASRQCVRVSILLSNRRISKGWRCWAKCWNWDCCSPDHATMAGNSGFMAALLKAGRLDGPKKAAVMLRIRRETSKFTHEQVAEIRASGISAAELAERHGINRSHAYRILAGAAYKAPTLPQASVFSWRPAA